MFVLALKRELLLEIRDNCRVHYENPCFLITCLTAFANDLTICGVYCARITPILFQPTPIKPIKRD
ncbi:hypothetical protein CCP3SC15_400011 [Gammaproteobacteria bacterium]